MLSRATSMSPCQSRSTSLAKGLRYVQQASTSAASEEIAMSDNEFAYLWNHRSAIQLRALTNRIYYQERQRIFETREGVIEVIAILGGSLAFSNIADPALVQWSAAIITVSTAASLVFGFAAKARDSAKRHSEWTLLQRDIELAGQRDFTESDLAKWAARCNEIEAGEPAAHPGLMERCYQRACIALGQAPETASPLSFWQRYCPPIVIP